MPFTALETISYPFKQKIHRHLFLVFVPLSQKELLPEIIVGGRGEGEAIDKV